MDRLVNLPEILNHSKSVQEHLDYDRGPSWVADFLEYPEKCGKSWSCLPCLSWILSVLGYRNISKSEPKGQEIQVERILDGVRWLGYMGLLPVRILGRAGLFLATAVFWVFVPPLKVGRLIRQIDFIGAKSVTIVALTGAFTGMVLTLESYYALERFGADALLGPAVALAMIREIGPVISAFMITARAGSALTAEIGIMRITEQIDALEMMGLNPFRYLIVPNLLAGIISFPLLGALFNVVGIYGGYLVGVKLLGVSAGTFFGEMPQYVDMTEILHGLYKSLTFGLVVAWICCYCGYTTGYGAEGVSKATTRAVVVSCVLILVCDYVITSLLF